MDSDSYHLPSAPPLPVEEEDQNDSYVPPRWVQQLLTAQTSAQPPPNNHESHVEYFVQRTATTPTIRPTQPEQLQETLIYIPQPPQHHQQQEQRHRTPTARPSSAQLRLAESGGSLEETIPLTPPVPIKRKASDPQICYPMKSPSPAGKKAAQEDVERGGMIKSADYGQKYIEVADPLKPSWYVFCSILVLILIKSILFHASSS